MQRKQSSCIPAHCKRHAEQKKLVASAAGSDDAAVAALPEEWQPKRGGPILKNYLKQREEDHQEVIKSLTEGAKKLNTSIDTKIRALAENLLSDIKQNEVDIQCIVEACDVSEPLRPDERNKALKNIHQLVSQRFESIERFKREALNLEKERANAIRIHLRDHFQRVIAVGNKPPKELLHDFDELTYEANQQFLSNCRAYSELEAKLRAQADENVKRARSSLNQLCLGVQLSYRRQSAIVSSQSIGLSQQIRYSIFSADSKKSTGTSNIPQIENILDEVSEIQECVARILDCYKKAVKKIVNRFSGKLTDLRMELENRGFSELDFRKYDSNELREMINNAVKWLSSIKLPFSKKEALQDVTRLENSFEIMGSRLQDTYMLLHDSGHLWNAHIMRSALAQKLTTAAVEHLLANNDCTQLANEVQFNVAFEQMRTCSDVEKLQPSYTLLMSLLDKTAELYLQHHEAEISRLQEYMNLNQPMSDTLLAEFNCFLDKYPIERNDASVIDLTREESFTITSPIPRAVFHSELQRLSLVNWKNGFLESFKCCASELPDDLKRQSQAWVQEKKSYLDMRYGMKMMSHSIRAERVKSCLEFRKAQLRHHDTRLVSHIEAMYAFMDALPAEILQSVSLEVPDLYPINPWIDRIQANMDELLAREELNPEVKRLKMQSYATRLAKLMSLFEQSLGQFLVEYRRGLEHRIQAARISNIRFLSVIKLFYEGGCYAAHESLKTLAAIVKAGEALEVCAVKSSDLLNYRRSQLLARVDEIVAPLRRHTENYVKPVGMGALKQAKPVQKQKKK